MKHYTFVDYATQIYATMVVLLILLFHNGTVPNWRLLMALNAGVVVCVHILIRWHARALQQGSAPLAERRSHSAPAAIVTADVRRLSSDAAHELGLALQAGHGATTGPDATKCETAHALSDSHSTSNATIAADIPGEVESEAARARSPLRASLGSMCNPEAAPSQFAPQPSTLNHQLLDFLRHFYPVLLYAFFFCETGLLNRMFFPEYMDPIVIRWEQAIFGFQPSVLFMQNLPYLAVSELFYASYFSYYVMIAGVGIALFIRNRNHFFHYVSVISFVFYICYTIYIFIPVIGPRVFFREIDSYNLPAEIQQLAVVDYYPEAIHAGPFYQLMAWIYRTFESPGAALPSSHVAIACCTVFFSFLYLRKIRYLHLGMAVLLFLSTVYCRYHYAVDVLTGLLAAALLLPLGHYLYRSFDKSRSLLQTRKLAPWATKQTSTGNKRQP